MLDFFNYWSFAKSCGIEESETTFWTKSGKLFFNKSFDQNYRTTSLRGEEENPRSSFACGLAVRIFPALRDKKYEKTKSYAEQKQGIASNLNCPNPPSIIIVLWPLWKLLNTLFHSIWRRTMYSTNQYSQLKI